MRDIEDLVHQYEREFPEIRRHEEEDWTWREEAGELVQLGHYSQAETLLKKLIVAQPEHHDGYEGLALLYQRLGRSDALPLIKKAYELALGFYHEKTLDQGVLTEIESEVQSIERAFGQPGSPDHL